MSKVKCFSCDWSGYEDDLEIKMSNIPYLWNRISPGQEVPAGECGQCGGLCYLDLSDDRPNIPKKSGISLIMP